MRLALTALFVSLLASVISHPSGARDSAGIYALWTRARLAVRDGNDLQVLAELEAACGNEKRRDLTETLFAAECSRWIGEQRLALGRLDDAAEALTTAHALYTESLGAFNPLSGELLYLLSAVYLELDDPTRAELAMDRALAIVPPLGRLDAERCRAVYFAVAAETAPASCETGPSNRKPAPTSVRASAAGLDDSRFGMFPLGNNRRYRGFHVGGVREGYGLEIGANSAEFWRGNYESGSLNGRAVWVTVSDGSVSRYYAGNWKRGRHHGYGTSLYENGNRYTGEHRNGVSQGVGEFVWSSGSRYSGSFKAAKFDGEGTLDVPGFYHFVGTWKDGKRQGYGVDDFVDGLIVYRGEYVENRPKGRGRVLVLGQEVFAGGLDPDVGIGFGTVASPNGAIYAGQLRNGIPDGFGLERAADGAITTGVWIASRRAREWTGQDLAAPATLSEQ